jgi:hypothetical protein
MDEQHKRDETQQINIESGEGQRDLLCCNKGFSRCPSLEYRYLNTNEENLNKAFDIIFEEVIKRQ